MDGAIIPEFKIPGPVQAETSMEEKQDLQAERILASLAEHPGWPDFVKHYRARVMELRTLAGVNMANLDDARVGQLTRAHQLAAQLMEEELSRVEQTAAVIQELPVDGS